MTQELIGIQIQIAGKAFPLKVPIAEQELVRNVEHHINDKIDTLQKTYPRQEKQDYLSMAFFAYAMDAQKNLSTAPYVPEPVIASPAPVAEVVAVNNNDVSIELTEKIKFLDAFLDKILAS